MQSALNASFDRSGNRKWTEADIDRVAGMLREGKTGSQIAPHFGVSRQAVCGLVFRNKRLADIGFQHTRRSQMADRQLTKRPRRKHWTDEERERLRQLRDEGKSASEIGLEFGMTRRAIQCQFDRMKAVRTNVVRFPRPRPARLVQDNVQAARTKPKLRVIVNTDKMVDEWLKQNGGARKFERGFSTDYLNLKNYLAPRGITLGLHHNKPQVSAGRGRPQKVTWEEVWAIADEFRIAEGKTPIIARSA